MTQAFNLSQLANRVNTSGQLNVATGATGTLPVANGGTGLSSTPTNGQLDIGNGSGFTRATLTAGSNISITNGAGTITIASTAGAPTTAQVLSATAGLTAGDVGSYGFFRQIFTTNYTDLGPGGTRAGSGLEWVGVYNEGGGSVIYSAGSPSGTWRCLGRSQSNTWATSMSTLWVRIS